MNSSELRQKFLDFFEKHGHAIVPSSSLLPADPSVLFTTAGMQQFKLYYLGEKSPWGPNVASCQKCIRTSDIDEVGDESHLTFFEMLGNFSFGGYFKEEAIRLAHEFIAKELSLTIDYVTIFGGDDEVPKDEVSKNAWLSFGVSDIRECGRKDNFWGPTGEEGPCGPTTEIYVNGVEIWNLVFNEFFCGRDKKLEKLETPGVDTGMGLERLAMVVNGKKDVFETDLFNNEKTKEERIVIDHVKASLFMISDGLTPSNTGGGYVLRRLIRRAVRLSKTPLIEEIEKIRKIYQNVYVIDDKGEILEEESIFKRTLEQGLKEFDKLFRPRSLIISGNNRVGSGGITFFPLTGDMAFLLSDSFGFPIELSREEAKRRGIPEAPDLEEIYNQKLKEQKDRSRTVSAGMFKGGLADHKLETIKLHTAHHLLLAALQELFGKQVKQRGSNINADRLRIDFSFDRKLTDDEKKKVEDLVNEKIKQGLNVVKKEMPRSEAEKIGAEMEFGVKYGNTVSVYFIEDERGNVFSKEFCGGPHVKNTAELGKFKIIKEETLGSGVRRIKAVLE